MDCCQLTTASQLRLSNFFTSSLRNIFSSPSLLPSPMIAFFLLYCKKAGRRGCRGKRTLLRPVLVSFLLNLNQWLFSQITSHTSLSFFSPVSDLLSTWEGRDGFFSVGIFGFTSLLSSFCLGPLPWPLNFLLFRIFPSSRLTLLLPLWTLELFPSMISLGRELRSSLPFLFFVKMEDVFPPPPIVYSPIIILTTFQYFPVFLLPLFSTQSLYFTRFSPFHLVFVGTLYTLLPIMFTLIFLQQHVSRYFFVLFLSPYQNI